MRPWRPATSSQRGEHGRLVGDVDLERVGAGRAHLLERLRRARAARDRPAVGEQPLDDREAEVAGADDECGGHPASVRLPGAAAAWEHGPVTTAQAATLVAPGRLEVREYPVPEELEPGAVLLRMLASGICGTDKHTFRGETEQYAGTDYARSTPFPIIQGHENVGDRRTGRPGRRPRVGRPPLRPGDRVVPAPEPGLRLAAASACAGSPTTSAATSRTTATRSRAETLRICSAAGRSTSTCGPARPSSGCPTSCRPTSPC